MLQIPEFISFWHFAFCQQKGIQCSSIVLAGLTPSNTLQLLSEKLQTDSFSSKFSIIPQETNFQLDLMD